MKTMRITRTAILSLLLGIAVPAYAQHEEQGEKQDHSDQQQQGKHEQAKPEKQQHAQPQQHDQRQQRQEQSKQSNQAQQQERNTEQQHAQQPQQQDRTATTAGSEAAGPQQATTAAQQQQQQTQQVNTDSASTATTGRIAAGSAWQQAAGSQHWDSDHRTWQQRGGYHGYRIPDDRFRGYFGPSHGFRIYGLPFLVVGGYPRFQYEGYWFSPVDPWPEYWGNDWYDNDDVYVNYVDNGYYLYNRRYPNVAIAINVSM